MDAELVAFLTNISNHLEQRLNKLEQRMIESETRLRSEMTAMEERLNARIDGVGVLASISVRTLRVRDMRLLALEERAIEQERRINDLEKDPPDTK